MTRPRRLPALFVTLILVAASLSGCDSVLEEDPKTFRNPDNYYQTASEVEAATNGIYAPLYTYDGFKYPMWADSACDSDITHCVSWFGGGMAGAWEGTWWQGRQWSGYYTVIGRANTLLQYVPDSPVGERQKNVAVGQALFLRGYAYFSLAVRYGDVPIRSELYDPSDGAFGDAPRAPVSQVFQQATSDLKRAASLLPADYSSGYQRGRPTAAAAKGMLAKTYLHMGGAQFTSDQSHPEWYDETLATNKRAYLDSARTWAGEVVEQAENTGYPSLAEDYSSLFDREAQDETDEVLFSIQASPVNSQGSELPLYYNPQGLDFDRSGFTGGNDGQGYGAVRYRYKWVQSQEEGDIRFEVGTMLHDRWLRYGADPTYVKEALPDSATSGGEPCDPNFSTNGATQQFYEGVAWAVNDAFCTTPGEDFIRVSPRYFSTKYVDPAANSKTQNGTNPIVLRYADVLLVYAEALAQTGRPQEAVDQLNKVRARAQASTYGGPADVAAPSLEEAIWAERARELYAEHDRRWDLLRQGRYFERMREVGKSRAPRKRLLPLPEQEVNSNAEIQTNNPGY